MPRLTNHELRVCDYCGRENVRHIKHRAYGEVACSCGHDQFTLYDPVWVEREHITEETPA